jgi:shikimate kinase
LIGFQGVGKSYWGQRWAEKLGVVWIDTDRLLPAPPREIVRVWGEERFRRMEEAAVLALDPPEECVISTGGGTLLSERSARHLKRLGTLIYFRGPLNQERIDRDSVVWENLHRVYEERRELYERWADVRIDGF